MTGCRCGSISLEQDRYKRLSCAQKVTFWMQVHACERCGTGSPSTDPVPAMVAPHSAYDRMMGREARP